MKIPSLRALPPGETLIPKKDLVVGAYYYGYCRNANIARWAGQEFRHWRTKWGSRFIETIKHPEDEDWFDVFQPVKVVDWGVDEIPLED